MEIAVHKMQVSAILGILGRILAGFLSAAGQMLKIRLRFLTSSTSFGGGQISGDDKGTIYVRVINDQALGVTNRALKTSTIVKNATCVTGMR